MRNALYFTLGLSLAFFLCAPRADAAGVPGTFWGVSQGIPYTGTTAGAITTYTPTPGSFGPVGGGAGWSSPAASTGAASWSATAGGGATAARNLTVSAGGATATLVQKWKIPASVIGTQVGKIAKGGIAGVAVGIVVPLLTAQGLQWIAEQQAWVKGAAPPALGYTLFHSQTTTNENSTPAPTAEAACRGSATNGAFVSVAGLDAPTSGYVPSSSDFNSVSGGQCLFGRAGYCSNCYRFPVRQVWYCGSTYSASGTCSGSPVPATPTDIDTAAASAAGADPVGSAQAASQAPWDIPGNTPAEIQVPGSAVQTPGKTSTQTDANGNVTTSTTYQSITFNTSGDTITNNTFSTTVNNVTTTSLNGVPQSTTTSPADPAKDDPPTFSDPTFPVIGTLYERKYPDGLNGVWNDHKAALLQSAFITSITQMFSFSASGSCPQWSMSFGIFSNANLGSHNFDVPCWIYTAIGFMMLLTAAFTARAIIFGG